MAIDKVDTRDTKGSRWGELSGLAVDIPWWEDLVTGIEKPIVKNGFVKVPETPGLGVDLNEPVVRAHLVKDTGYFDPTPEWTP